MVQQPRRTGLSGPALIRLLARLTDIEATPPGQSPTDRLGSWQAWTDAIALSAALDGDPPAVPASARGEDGEEARACADVRAYLEKSIEGVFAPRRRASPTGRGVQVEEPTDFSIYRQRYLTLQQTMENAIGSLRVRLRTMLAASAADMARLAVLDAVMERVLGAREHNLLAGVPGLLETRYRDLRQREESVLAEAEAAQRPAPVRAGAWLDAFRRDLRAVMHAELALRLQPVDGLLSAFRT
ncbi:MULTISPECIES: DUF3348 domain-containing protein [unclassified Achromobacter]|jgi:hypothetical protein|uniref:DUF3348 domain-containing protein n=1 Tax=unclassified Achromobacter TaxID=2626865 RepID=UPI000B51AE8C|nr:MULTISPECIES: DUF3348 domain-containing protein [unclassified Achromobacter]OWT73541.1 hypothetical protein CEY05_20730 [Achromobacter sp. HZ34]OWT79541.1 hypothetical protein CEY04_11250 [Achromobacter sp. HZ28]